MAENGSSTEELTPKQVQAVQALMTCPTITKAAKAAEVGERTLHTWLGEPAFRAALNRAESQALDDAARHLVSLAEKALSVVADIMNNKKTSATVRLRAAGVILDQLLKLYELRNLAQRVELLERQVQREADTESLFD